MHVPYIRIYLTVFCQVFFELCSVSSNQRKTSCEGLCRVEGHVDRQTEKRRGRRGVGGQRGREEKEKKRERDWGRRGEGEEGEWGRRRRGEGGQRGEGRGMKKRKTEVK